MRAQTEPDGRRPEGKRLQCESVASSLIIRLFFVPGERVRLLLLPS